MAAINATVQIKQKYLIIHQWLVQCNLYGGHFYFIIWNKRKRNRSRRSTCWTNVECLQSHRARRSTSSQAWQLAPMSDQMRLPREESRWMDQHSSDVCDMNEWKRYGGGIRREEAAIGGLLYTHRGRMYCIYREARDIFSDGSGLVWMHVYPLQSTFVWVD